LTDELAAELAELVSRDRLRTLAPTLGEGPLRTTRQGRRLVAFCSNDYLGLANHPALAQAATDMASRHGFGAGASRLVSGHSAVHADLEHALARYVALPEALLFSTGYQANLGVLTSLAGPRDLIVSDAANHASIIDGCRLSRARVCIYPHRDARAAAALISQGGDFRRRLLVTESLFSMDGDRAPLAQLATATAAASAALVVDEAHALGALGPRGRGLCAEVNVKPDVLVGTLGKAFGAFGGFVAGAAPLRAFLLNRARPFIYTTALPPPVAAAALAGVLLAESAEGDARRKRLADNMALVSASLAGVSDETSRPSATGPIFPLVLGKDARALAAAETLAEAGFLVPAIRPPTVPEATARLRITVSADHQPSEVAALAAAVRSIIRLP
jgi:8-amino-7-oxononanoate synthase